MWIVSKTDKSLSDIPVMGRWLQKKSIFIYNSVHNMKEKIFNMTNPLTLTTDTLSYSKNTSNSWGHLH
jgi:hypothetical protein